MSFEENLQKYADIAIRVGLNLQPGQRLLVRAVVTEPAQQLTRAVVKAAYEAGARYVDVLWSDDQQALLRLQHAPADSFEEFSQWRVDAALETLNAGGAMLSIGGGDPDLLKGQDAGAIATMRQTAARASQPASAIVSRMGTNWLGIVAPNAAWAAKLFPDVPAAAQVPALWDAIFAACRVELADPVAAWEAHIAELAARQATLTGKQYDALHLTGPGTDLTLGLPANHVWLGGRVQSENGIGFVPNVPTEEIFTAPHRARVDGVVQATMPLNISGTLIEDFRLTFEAGRVVKLEAASGGEILQQLVDTDEGAARLGEIALVPHSSPISQSGILFYNTLYDENASCHVALGRAYKISIQDGADLADDVFQAAGGNTSLIHIDFMIGSAALDVDGLTADGTVEPVMRGGEWAFEV